MRNKSKGRVEARPDYFDSVRGSLRHWPYTIHQIDDTLDVGLIEGRGKQLLFRAIHSENLVVFAGSGLSMSYGRLTWRDWEAEQKRTVERNADCFLELSKAALDWIEMLVAIVDPHTESHAAEGNHNAIAALAIWREVHRAGTNKKGDIPQRQRHNIWKWLQSRHRAINSAQRQISRLYETFRLTQEDSGHFPGGEELPVKFEIAQQLHNELRSYIGIFLPEPADNGVVPDDRSWPGALVTERDEAPVGALRRLESYLDAPLPWRSWGHRNLYLDSPYVETRELYLAALKKLAEASSRPEALLGFEEQAKALLLDECPHALILLRKGLLGGFDIDHELVGADDKTRVRQLENHINIFSDDNQRRDIKGIREHPERYRVLTPFKIFNLRKLATPLVEGSVGQPHWTAFWKTVDERLTAYVVETGSERIYLTPSSRFLVATALALAKDPFQILQIDDELKPDGCSSFLEEPALGDFKSRRSILADCFDPLPKVHRDLKVNRFITTNYDFEIERYFQDYGYRNFGNPQDKTGRTTQQDFPGSSDSFRSNNSGKILRDRTFDPERAAELTAFAVEDESEGASIYHLHGRATQEDALVITERDYMNLYLTEDRNRPTIDEAIQVAFSGSPLLFLGLGMEETDLLRPLRQFISNRDRTIGYTSIALLPAEDDIGARTKFSASLYLRYGVHTVFYGGGQLSYLGHKIKGTEKDRQFGIDWLNRILKIVRGMTSEIERWEIETSESDEKELLGRRSQHIFELLDKKVGRLEEDLAIAEEGANYQVGHSALKVLLDAEQSTGSQQLAQKIIDREISLRTCDFTAVRPGSSRAGPHNLGDASKVSGDTYLGFYTTLLSECMRMVFNLPETMREYDCVEAKLRSRQARQRIAAPMKVALDGLYGAFITGSLNAALTGIAREQQTWWENWQRPPQLRQADPQRIDTNQRDTTKTDDDVVLLGSCFVRHRIDNVITVLQRAKCETAEKHLCEMDENGTTVLRPENRTNVRSFDTFIAAVSSTFRHRHSPRFGAFIRSQVQQLPRRLFSDEPKRRQLITVAARRGMGKGTFMSALSTKLGLSAYKRASWPQDEVFFAGSIFINFGFSTEVASAYDMIRSALISITAALRVDMDGHEQSGPGVADAQRAARSVIAERIERLSRMAALKHLFDALSETAAAFRKAGQRRRQPRVLLNLCAIDLLFDHNRQPKNGEITEFLNLLFGAELHECPIDIIFLADDTRLGARWSMEKGNGDQRRLLLDRDGLPLLANEQIMRAQRASRITLDETLAQRDERLKRGLFLAPELETKEAHFIHFTRPVNPIWLKIDNFPVLAVALYLNRPPSGEINDGIETLRASFSQAVATGRMRSDKAIDELWKRKTVPLASWVAIARNGVAIEVRKECEAQICEHAGEHKRKQHTGHGSGCYTLEEALRYRLKTGVPDSDQWRETRRGLGNSRFSLTILMAAAENTIIHALDPMEGAADAEKLILDTVTSVRNVGHEKRDQMVLERVLDVYQDLHRIGEADLDYELHTLILRHLAVVGTPVGSAVLVRLTEFRRYFKRIGIELEVSRRRFLVRAITTLAYRGLVFRLDPHPGRIKFDDDQDWPASKEYRFALHRVVQSYALKNLGAGPSEAVQSNRFAPTLYSAMPSSGPTLSRASYRFLRTLMIGLSQYPDVPSNDVTSEPWLFTTKNLTTRAQAVRAALTLARSTYSVAVVSRLAEHKPIGSGVQDRGYLETYRVRLRWIIRIAWEMFADQQPDEAKEHLHVLYRDEIVWLYNELGVISLAQGSLSDSLGYLRQAAEENEKIEGLSRSSPIFNHIDLNHAIVQLERGNFDSARNRLERVERANMHMPGRLYHLAQGYQAVLDHLQGRRQGVKTKFENVTGFFQEYQEDRAAAIFLMHFARFLGEEDHKKSISLVMRARNLAETAGHEDVRHHIELAMLQLKVSGPDDDELTLAEQKAINKVENFGRRMAVWSLQVDALRLRAKLLLKQNETATAGRLLTRAMAIAKRHSQTLRLNSCMTLYANVLHDRGDLDGAALMAQRSLDLAKDVGYSLETARAQNVLGKCAQHTRY